jgi:hypothetical protein
MIIRRDGIFYENGNGPQRHLAQSAMTLGGEFHNPNQ